MEIRAQVFNLRNLQSQPNQNDQFLVDSNVWIWAVYQESRRQANRYQAEIYPKYILSSFNIGANLFSSELSLSELSNYIERAEFDKFVKCKRNEENLVEEQKHLLSLMQEQETKLKKKNQNSFLGKNQKVKLFRHCCPNKRVEVIEAIDSAWTQVQAMSASLEITLDQELGKRALNNLYNRQIDAYDLFMVESMMEKGIKKIITDDGDFATVENIEVYTANNNVIEEARRQKKLT